MQIQNQMQIILFNIKTFFFKKVQFAWKTAVKCKVDVSY